MNWSRWPSAYPGTSWVMATTALNELIDIVNEDPRRGIGHEKVLTRLELDHQAERLMEKDGVDKDTVLAEGKVFYLRSTANLSTGGTAIDMTDVVHPDNREMAVGPCRRLGWMLAVSIS